jgi:hypothetical protein
MAGLGLIQTGVMTVPPSITVWGGGRRQQGSENVVQLNVKYYYSSWNLITLTMYIVNVFSDQPPCKFREKVRKECPKKYQDRQCRYILTLRRFLAAIFAVEKEWVLHILRVCVCSFKYPSCNAHSPHCHLWFARLNNIFPHYLINGTIIEKKTLLNKNFVFWFSVQLLPETYLILRRTDRDIMNVYWSSYKVPVILVRFSKIVQISNFMKIHPVGEELFHAEIWTDITKLIVAFHNFAKAPKTLW